jgi:NAD(P)-dependent dehydrogenase (short-subunit alcohol dehydrogenase family)
MTYKPFDLTGKVALITGGNGGIGLGFAEAVAAAGANVCIWGTNKEKNAAALGKLRAYGTHVSASLCNVADEKQVENGFQEVLKEFGRVDACFANAGVYGKANSFLEISAEEWSRVIGVNLTGAFYTFRAAARHMVERAKNNDSGGRLIGTASLAAISGAARNEQYAASKGGMVSMIKALAVEFARYGVTANAILPGWIETDMTEGAFNWKKFADAVMPRIPMRRWGRPDDFGAVAVYLMSDASVYHSGQSFCIDGGYLVF